MDNRKFILENFPIEAYRLGVLEEHVRIVKLLEEMQKTALATRTRTGKRTAWVLEYTKVIIKREV
jgi:hypothetical protein